MSVKVILRQPGLRMLHKRSRGEGAGVPWLFRTGHMYCSRVSAVKTEICKGSLLRHLYHRGGSLGEFRVSTKQFGPM